MLNSIAKSKSVITSLILVLLSQFLLLLIPLYFPYSSIPTQLVLSAIILLTVTGFGKACRLLLNASASAPVFVLFNIFFIFGVHVMIIRKEVSLLMNFLVSSECVLLVVGLYRIIYSDPGWDTYGDSCLKTLIQNPVYEPESHSKNKELSASSACLQELTVLREQESVQMRRVRYCKSCNKYIRGFDHHCPAFGNCIGQKNHHLFMLLLVGFIVTEVSFIVLSSHCYFVETSPRVNKLILKSKANDLYK